MNKRRTFLFLPAPPATLRLESPRAEDPSSVQREVTLFFLLFELSAPLDEVFHVTNLTT